MATKKISSCVGIEIVGNNFNCAVITKNRGFVFTEELPHDMVEMNSLVYGKETSKFIKNILKKYTVRIKDCSLIIPEVASIVKNVDVGILSHSAVLKNLPFEFQGDGAGPDFLYDYAVTSLHRNFASEVTGMTILAMGVDEDHLLDQKAILNGAKLNLYSATCKENALCNIIRAYQNFDDDLDVEESFCFIEIGYKNTKVHFFKGIKFELTRGIEYGVFHIEQAISRSLSIPVEKAREHIQNQARLDFDKLEAVVSMYTLLSVEVKKTIAFYNSKSFGNQVNEVICMGEGTRISSMVNAIDSAVNLPFYTAENRLAPFLGIEGGCFDQCVVAIGAALQI